MNSPCQTSMYLQLRGRESTIVHVYVLRYDQEEQRAQHEEGAIVAEAVNTKKYRQPEYPRREGNRPVREAAAKLQ